MSDRLEDFVRIYAEANAERHHLLASEQLAASPGVVPDECPNFSILTDLEKHPGDAIFFEEAFRLAIKTAYPGFDLSDFQEVAARSAFIRAWLQGCEVKLKGGA